MFGSFKSACRHHQYHSLGGHGLNSLDSTRLNAIVVAELEEHLELIGRREDALVPRTGVRAAPLQAHPAVCHGRDRRCAGV